MARTGWAGRPDAVPRGSGPIGALRVAVRGPALVALVSGGLALLLALRLVEAPIHGAARPWTPAITRFVCRNALRILGIRRRVTGSPLRGGGALVANHSSWLDVFALNSAAPLYFVAKAEVAGWPGIGWLARATGTVFIERRRTEAARHRAQFEERLRAGHLLAFFPEGTSTDGRRLLPFKTTLFEAFFSAGVEGLRVQPVAMIWTAPPGRPDDHFGWWGTMGLGPHLLSVLAAPPGGRVELAFEPPIPVEGGRKTLAARTEAAVRAALEERLGSVPVR